MGAYDGGMSTADLPYFQSRFFVADLDRINKARAHQIAEWAMAADVAPNGDLVTAAGSELSCYEVIYVPMGNGLQNLCSSIEVWSTSPAGAQRAALAVLNRHGDAVDYIVGIIDLSTRR